MKQSGRNWNNLLHTFFINNNFIQSPVDPCVYFNRDNQGLVISLIWVDDILLAASTLERLNKIKILLKETFKMKDLGPISSFLGMKFSQTDTKIEMDQSKYLQKVLVRFGMEQCKPRSTPCELKPSAFNSEDSFSDPKMKYREIGSLIYAMICTRPDLSWVVTKLSQNLEKPTQADWIMVKHVLRYMKGTVNQRLVYTKAANFELTGYSDSDWAGSTPDRRSTTGYCFMLNPKGAPVSWKSKKQPTVALSSCEAEYMALSASTQEAHFLAMLLSGFQPDKSFEPVLIQGDNQGALSLVKNNIVHNLSKHIDIRYHYIRESYHSGRIDVLYVPSELNVADVLTKPVSRQKLDWFKIFLFGK